MTSWRQQLGLAYMRTGTDSCLLDNDQQFVDGRSEGSHF